MIPMEQISNFLLHVHLYANIRKIRLGDKMMMKGKTINRTLLFRSLTDGGELLQVSVASSMEV